MLVVHKDLQPFIAWQARSDWKHPVTEKDVAIIIQAAHYNNDPEQDDFIVYPSMPAFISPMPTSMAPQAALVQPTSPATASSTARAPGPNATVSSTTQSPPSSPSGSSSASLHTSTSANSNSLSSSTEATSVSTFGAPPKKEVAPDPLVVAIVKHWFPQENVSTSIDPCVLRSAELLELGRSRIACAAYPFSLEICKEVDEMVKDEPKKIKPAFKPVSADELSGDRIRVYHPEYMDSEPVEQWYLETLKLLELGNKSSAFVGGLGQLQAKSRLPATVGSYGYMEQGSIWC